MGVGGQRHSSAAVPLGKKPGTHCAGGRMVPRVGLDGYGKSRPQRDSMTGLSRLQPVTTPTALFRPHKRRIVFTSIIFTWHVQL